LHVVRQTFVRNLPFIKIVLAAKLLDMFAHIVAQCAVNFPREFFACAFDGRKVGIF